MGGRAITLRKRLARACVAAAALAVVGCTHSSTKKSLTVSVNAGVEGEALKIAAREWGQATGTQVEIVELPYANLFEKELLDLKSRTGAYDVVMMDDPWFPQFAQGGQLTELDPLYAKAGQKGPDADFIKSTLDVCRNPWATGSYYALPYVGNSQLFFYRQDLFQKYGLAKPATWDDVLSAAKKIGAGEKMFGYVMRAAPGNAVVADYMPLLWAFGGDIFSPDGKTAVVDSPDAVAALKFMLELGKVTPPGYTGFNADEVSAHILQSTAAMSINWPAWIAPMDDPAKSKVVDKVGFATIPSGKHPGQPELGAWLVAIPAGSHHVDAAFEFLRWATTPERMKIAALRGNPPTRESVFDDPELLKKFRAFPIQKASLQAARPRPRTPDWNEVENAFGIYLSKANAGSLSPEEAMKKAREEIQAIISRNP